MPADRAEVLGQLAMRAGRKVIVEIGCGPRKEHADSIGVDVSAHESVDLCGPAEGILPLFPGDSVDEIYSRHFLEHVEDPRQILEFAAAALRPGGKLVVTVPHFSNPYFYSDPTHRHVFGLYSFAYFAEGDLFRRTVPAYARVDHLKLIDVQLGFRSVRPFYIRHVLRRVFGALVNFSRLTQEWYEDALSGLFACYEITAVMEKRSLASDDRSRL